MDCHTAEPFVGMLYDGEEAPEEAVQHITGCPACRARLREYAAIASEIRVLAAAETQNLRPLASPATLPSRRRWRFTLGSPVRVPRFALVMGIVIITGLSVALGYVEKQRRSQDLWFRCDFRLPESQYTGPIHPANRPQWGWGFRPPARLLGPRPFFLVGPETQLGAVAGIVDIQQVRSDSVDFAIQAKHIDTGGQSLKAWIEKQRAAGPFRVDDLRDILAGAPLRHYRYEPGTLLRIPLEGGGTLIFHGEVGDKLSAFSSPEFPLEPAPDEIVLDQPALVVEKSLILRPGGAVKVSGPKACAYMYIPGKGLLVLSLHAFSGAHEAAVDRSDAMFELDHEWYYLFAHTPIAPGDLPQTIWVYLAKNYEPSQSGLKWDPGNPFVGSAQDVTQVLAQLKQ
jgi:hypothetical protein